MTTSNGQFRVDYKPGSVKLMIIQDDGSCRSLEVTPVVAQQIGLGIIHASHIAQLPPGVAVASESQPLKFDAKTIREAEKICAWVDDYAKGVK